MRSFLPLLAAAALLASGCGTAGTPLALGGMFAKGPGQAGFGGEHKLMKMQGGKGGPGMRPGHPGGHGPALGVGFPGVVLSAEQQVQLKALAEKYAPAKPDEAAVKAAKEAHEAARVALSAELMKATFDATAFKAALAGLQAGQAPPARDPQFAVEARALLTDAQRAAAIAVIKALPAPAEGASAKPQSRERLEIGAPDRLATALGLNADQQARLAAIQGEPPARPDAAATRAAQIAFLETGDPASLPQPPAPKALPVDAITAFVASLDGPQRGKLAAVGLPFGGGHPAHGKGGPMPGGKPGHGKGHR